LGRSFPQPCDAGFRQGKSARLAVKGAQVVAKTDFRIWQAGFAGLSGFPAQYAAAFVL
jgi:hypothetical protein